MDLKDLLLNSGGVLFIALTLVQVVPVKLNPWSVIAKYLGRALNVEVMEKIDENAATTSRYRIIRFDDELRHKEQHTKEHFDQIMEDIDTYERYCQSHPTYQNHKGQAAVQNVKEKYAKCKNENSFL